MYSLPAVLLRTVFALLGVAAVYLYLSDHIALAFTLLIVGMAGMLGLNIFLRGRRP